MRLPLRKMRKMREGAGLMWSGDKSSVSGMFIFTYLTPKMSNKLELTEGQR